jgi:chemotaxis signal transduction protein
MQRPPPSRFAPGVTGRGDILRLMDIEVPAAEGDRRFLLVRSGGTFYAVPASQVRHVVRGLACHPVPGGQAHLLGLAQFAGEPLAVLDLHAMVEGAPPQSSHRTTVILGRGAGNPWTAVGLAVNDALRVQTVARITESGRRGELVSGTVDLDGERFKVVNTAVLFEEHRPSEGGRRDD